jgi:glycosyltransferase involved in cell wall biosynthesis
VATTLTVVVPALNEAERLPLLLDTLDGQTTCADQVVVADAGSTDGTRQIAAARGAIVVDGGKPAAGRNAGARAATGDLLLFLDADDQLHETFIEDCVREFQDRGLTCATTFMEPIEREPGNVLACEVANLYMDAMQYVAPHAPGFCILIRRDAHEAIGGFDETVLLAEDHEYVQRAAEIGKFRVLRDARVGTSMRRIEKEGLVRLAFMYLYCELYVVTGRPIKKVPFDYEFAAFAPAERTEAQLAIGVLRERLGELAEGALEASSDGLDALLRLGSREVDPRAFESALRGLRADDVRRLTRYVGARVRLARRTRSHAVARVRKVGAAVWRALGGNQ